MESVHEGNNPCCRCGEDTSHTCIHTHHQILGLFGQTCKEVARELHSQIQEIWDKCNVQVHIDHEGNKDTYHVRVMCMRIHAWPARCHIHIRARRDNVSTTLAD